DHLRAVTGLELEVVEGDAHRDVLERQAVPGTDVRGGARDDALSDLQAHRRQDVALLAVRVVEQRDVRRAVGIVLDRRDLGGNAVLVPTLEVDDAVAALVPSALVAAGDVAVVVAATGAGQLLSELLLRRRL